MAYCTFSWVDDRLLVHQWDVLNLMPDQEQQPMSLCNQCSKKAVFQIPSQIIPATPNACTSFVRKVPLTDCVTSLSNQTISSTFATNKSNPETEEKGFCNKHAKTSPFFLPSSPSPSLTKMKKEDLEKWVEEKTAVMASPLKKELLGKKPETKTAILEWIKQNTLLPCRLRKKTQEIGLVEIGRKMTELLSQQIHLEGITHVLIENQISPIATRMKTIQGMLTQYFILRLPDVPIEFVSSHNKLKVFSSLGETQVIPAISATPSITQSYADNKKKSIKGVIEEVFPYLSIEQQTFFHQHKKKDDLADCLLQGLWFVKMKK